MAVENDFLPFAVGSGANVLSQSAYAALSAISQGYQSGTAQSAALNKTWRQSSIMAAVLAELIVNVTGQAAIDDGTTATLLANLQAAITALASQSSGLYLGTQTILETAEYTPGTYNGVTATKARFRGVAAGGGSGGNPATSGSQAAISGAGNAGNPFDFWVVSGLAAMAITIGAAGAAGAAGANAGGNGGDLLIGSIATIKGGKGGLAGVASSTFPYVGPIGSLNVASTIANAAGMTLAGIINGLGQIGSNGTLLSAGAAIYGSGGASAYGCGGASGSGGGGYGAGAGSISSPVSATAAPGFAGMPGILSIDEYA